MSLQRVAKVKTIKPFQYKGFELPVGAEVEMEEGRASRMEAKGFVQKMEIIILETPKEEEQDEEAVEVSGESVESTSE